MEKNHFDVLITFTNADAHLTSKLVERLTDDGLVVATLNSDQLASLDVSQIPDAKVMLLVLSENVAESEWTLHEALTYLFRDAANDSKRFVPVLLDKSLLPESLRSFAYLTWQERGAEEYAKILLACSKQTDDAAKTELESYLHITPVRTARATYPLVGVALSEDELFVLTVTGIAERWDTSLNDCTTFRVAPQQANSVWALSVSNDNQTAVIGSFDKSVYVLSLTAAAKARVIQTNQGTVWVIKHLQDPNEILVGCSAGFIARYDIRTGECLDTLVAHQGPVYALALSPNGEYFASSSRDGTIREWDAKKFVLVREHKLAVVNAKGVAIATRALAYSNDSTKLFSGSADGAIRIWNRETGHLEAILEGHTRSIRALLLNATNNILLSTGQDHKVKLWNWETGTTLATLTGLTSYATAATFSADGKFVYAGSRNSQILKWDVSGVSNAKLDLPVTASKRYTNAKVLLVGDSGVGKTGLAYRLATGEFQSSISTDGVWATQLKIDSLQESTIDREIWLWDFAGQADYRLIHQLYMDETAAAVLVFNPQSDAALEGLAQWDRDIERAARRNFKKFLVAGRVDRGGLTISRSTIEEFKITRGFVDFFETSALTGHGCAEVRSAVINHIDWNDTPWISSPRIFRLLKSQIVAVRDSGVTILRMSELKQQIELRLPNEQFSIEQLRAVTGLLAGPGIVWSLEFGDFVLLQPERLNSYAAAVIRSVRSHAEEIGSINEDKVLNGILEYQDMERLQPEDEQIVLRAMHQTFVDHGLCLREHTENGTVLIFPSYFKRERPDLTGHPVVLVTYKFFGSVDEIYATLVVKLHHTSLVERDKLWRFAADFKSALGKRLGIRVRRSQDGGAELDVYFEPAVPLDIQVNFIRYVHDHLSNKAYDVIRRRHYVCTDCGEPFHNPRAVEIRLEKGFKDVVCPVCENRISLWDVIEERYASEDTRKKVRDLDEMASVAIDNESRELILEGHARAIAGEAGQIYRGYTNSDHGIDGEIEFKNEKGDASGIRLYVQLKSGDSYLYSRRRDGAEVFYVSKPRWAEYWTAQAYPVMLVIRTSDNVIRWMNVTDYLKRNTENGVLPTEIIFKGETMSALNVRRARQKAMLLKEITSKAK